MLPSSDDERGADFESGQTRRIQFQGGLPPTGWNLIARLARQHRQSLNILAEIVQRYLAWVSRLPVERIQCIHHAAVTQFAGNQVGSAAQSGETIFPLLLG